MSLGSIAGAVAGGYVSLAISQNALRLVLAAILTASAFKLWSKRGAGYQREKSATKPAG
jgi:uncharacterized membrane protein YfcA